MKQQQRGMVLVAVLWVLVGMTLAASVMALRVEHDRQRAERLESEALAQVQAYSVQAAMVYSRIVNQASPDGVSVPLKDGQVADAASAPVFNNIEEFLSGAAPRLPAREDQTLLRLDGQPARDHPPVLRLDSQPLAFGDLRVLAQDSGGLIGITDINNRLLYQRLASRALAGNPEHLRDTLADYIDADSFSRLHGAEAADYRRLNRPEPPNGVLRSPLQLRDVLGWDDALRNHDDAWILRNFRIAEGTFINVNSAPVSALQLVLPQPEGAEALVEQRVHTPWREVFAVAASQGAGEDLPVGITPGNGLRFWWWRDGDAAANVNDIQFAPMQSGRDAVHLNWSTRVALSEELAEHLVEDIDHAFFQPPPAGDRGAGGSSLQP